MNQNIKAHLISAIRVFLSVFIVSIAGAISTSGSITWTKEFWIPVAVAAVSTGLKAAYQTYIV